MLLALVKQDEQASLTVGKFLSSLGQLIWLSIPSSTSTGRVGSPVDLTREQKMYTASFFCCCCFELNIGIKLYAGNSGLYSLEVNKIVWF